MERILPSQKGCLKHPELGFSLIEVLVATAVSAIALAGLLVAYDLVDKQYSKIRDISTVRQAGGNVLRVLERDLRMTGFAYRTDSGVITFGEITTPITVVDSGANCCDEMTVIYDRHDEAAGTTDRVRIRYWVKSYTGTKGTRGRLFKQVNILAPAPSISTGPEEVMADFIEDLQIVRAGTSPKPDQLIEIYLALRTSAEYDRNVAYQREGHFPGNSDISRDDGYRRSGFSTSVALRNLAL